MRLILEIIAGSEKGRKLRLTADQNVVVGRTEWADFVVPTDPRMSSQHFSINVDHEQCHLSDLNSANGTFVNDKRVSQVVLRDGDLVIAGETTFVVRLNVPLEGETVEINRAPIAGPQSSSASSEPLPVGSEIRVKIASSGLHQADCGTEPLPPRELIDRIVRECPIYLIVDFRRLGTPVPAELTDPAYLFDWLPEAARRVSPVVVDLQAWPAGMALLESAWGKDALVCLGYQLGPGKLLEHLRSRARARGDSVLGFCWPVVLSALLMDSRPDIVRHLLGGIDWMLTENPDDPSQWQFFSGIDLHSFFDGLGLATIVASPAAP